MSAPAASARPELRIPRPRAAIAVPAFLVNGVAFAGLCSLAVLHWMALVEPAPLGRALWLTLFVTCGGMLIALTAPLRGLPGTALRVALAAALVLLALGVIGLKLRLLWPKEWDTLHDRISGGLNASGSVSSWPYGGPNEWLRLTTLLAAPLVAGLAAVFAFWPRRDGRPDPVLRFFGMVLLIALYAVVVAARPLDHDGLRGVGLLAAIAVWLWLPRMRPREAGVAAIALILAGLLAAPLAARVASPEPWVDYRQWSWSIDRTKSVTFEWNHAYGPLDWPRKGTTLMLVKSRRPHYWKARALERFDGFRWVGVPIRARDDTGSVVRPDKKAWTEHIAVTVRGLRSDVLIGAGTIFETSREAGPTMTLGDATYLLTNDIAEGDSYEVDAYVPDPTAKQMRAARDFFPAEGNLLRFTTLEFPKGGIGQVAMDLRGVPGSGDPGAVETLRSSEYARMYELALRVAGSAPTTYDIVKRLSAYLESRYRYAERVPTRRLPLMGFLFADRAGYCQQFSGSLALMLRMLGIPSRVTTGFTPGALDSKTKEYVVRDFDAHSWVEVWFPDIGWVPFDPTPTLAPAQSQSSVAGDAPSAARGDANDRVPRRRLDEILGGGGSDGASAGDLFAEERKGTPWGVIVGSTGIVLLIGFALAFAALRRHRRVSALTGPPPCGDAAVDDLIRLLARLGYEVDPRTTLLTLEQRLERLAGSEASGYARRLREIRYGSGECERPTRAERNRVRRALADAAGAGRLTRIRMALGDHVRPAFQRLKLAGPR